MSSSALFTRLSLRGLTLRDRILVPPMCQYSSLDGFANDWHMVDAIGLATMIGPLGVDAVDCSSGGLVAEATIPAGAGYQVPFAERVRREAAMPAIAVGLITSPEQAEQIVRRGQADGVMLARGFLRDPYWPIHAAQALGGKPTVPAQYLRAYSA